MYSKDSTGDTLSPFNIQDPLLRAELFREIRLAQTDIKYRGPDWGYYVIQPADILAPELIAWKATGVDRLKWLVMVAAELDDTRERLQAGTTIYLPTTAWLYDRIRHYKELETQ